MITRVKMVRVDPVLPSSETKDGPFESDLQLFTVHPSSHAECKAHIEQLAAERSEPLWAPPKRPVTVASPAVSTAAAASVPATTNVMVELENGRVPGPERDVWKRKTTRLRYSG